MAAALLRFQSRISNQQGAAGVGLGDAQRGAMLPGGAGGSFFGKRVDKKKGEGTLVG
jgi:hypothetical protein